MVLDVNTDAVVKYSAKLERLRKSGIPLAVRATLNDAAFDLKLKTMPQQASTRFTNRTSTFFRANSRAEKATGWNVNTMRSMVGFYSNNLKSDGGNPADNFAVRDLEQQEYGKVIRGKSFIPLDAARKGGYNTLVKPINRINRILNSGRMQVARNLAGSSKKEQFTRAILKVGVGGYVLGNLEKGKNMLWRVDSMYEVNGQKRFRKTALYSYRKRRTVKVKTTPFMRTASDMTAKKLESFYIQKAKFYFDKYLK